MIRRAALFLLRAVAVLALVALLLAPGYIDRSRNRTISPSIKPPNVSERARELHRRLFIADLHADSLLWDRDLADRNSRGHVDIPRLLEGNVGLQGFTVYTRIPKGLNIRRNQRTTTDLASWLMAVQMKPPWTWWSLKSRALYHAGLLEDYSAGSDGKLTLLRTRTDLESYLERRKSDPQITAALLGLEGAHALQGDVGNVERFYQAGYRMIGLAHFFDNDFAGSAHGTQRGGLTPLGRELVKELEKHGMLIDLAHSSPQTIRDVMSVAKRPVVVSHTGVKGTCNNERNLSDAQLRSIARSGGVIGIGFFSTAVCGSDVHAIVRAIRHAVKVVGVEHVALGSDFDGAVTVPFDASRMVVLTDALLQAGFSEKEIEAIMGGNVKRFLLQTLPN